MSDTEILDAIEAHGMWVHPAGGLNTGWNCDGGSGSNYFLAWNKPSLREAVMDVLMQMAAPPQEELLL